MTNYPKRTFSSDKIVSASDVSRPRLIRDASFLEADWKEITERRGGHNRLGFAYRRRCREGACTHKVTHHGSACAPRDAELTRHRVAICDARGESADVAQIPEPLVTVKS